MPELPEVEAVRRGIAPLLLGQRISRVVVRQWRLRWPIPRQLPTELPGQRIRRVGRRAKYLLVETGGGTLLLHLGMSGSLRVVPADRPPDRHDHLDLIFQNGTCLRLRDPRRFGAALWCRGDVRRHRLLAGLGPEPLEPEFDGDYLYDHARKRNVAVKNFIMNARVVAGIGNIYACEALYLAGVHPARPAGRISLIRYRRLAGCIRRVLREAISEGGTTLRDFVAADGRPGYFGRRLRVYGRGGEACERCQVPIRQRRIGQRSSFYCPACQR